MRNAAFPAWGGAAGPPPAYGTAPYGGYRGGPYGGGGGGGGGGPVVGGHLARLLVEFGGGRIGVAQVPSSLAQMTPQYIGEERGAVEARTGRGVRSAPLSALCCAARRAA